ncbi:hypothetical protein EYF80_067608 [Liparis tanakae]|nr:hypothetical protein EYF80_067608 [Liparis tanakae]
MCRGSS